MPRRIYKSDDLFVAEAELAHYGPAPLKDVEPTWTIRDDRDREVASGSLDSRSLPSGELTRLGLFVHRWRLPPPCRLTVTVALAGTEFTNSWEIWVYPPGPVKPPPAGLVVVRDWDDATEAALAAGKAVLLFPRRLGNLNSLPGRFLPVFWSPVWFPTQKPNTMGILCDPKHPALAQFPTDSYSNWQWYELLDHGRSVILDDTPVDFRPIVQVIDNFARNHKLGNLFEASVGAGRLLVCTIDLPRLASSNPAAGNSSAVFSPTPAPMPSGQPPSWTCRGWRAYSRWVRATSCKSSAPGSCGPIASSPATRRPTSSMAIRPLSGTRPSATSPIRSPTRS